MTSVKYLLLGLSLAASPAFAANVTYANISAPVNGVVSGSIGGITFTYSGETAFVNASNTGAFNYYNPVSTYTSTTVSNAPTNGGLIAIVGNGTTNTFTFSSPVTDLVFSEVSLGGVRSTSYTFDQPFTVLSCGPNSTYGGGCFNQAVGTTSNVLSGQETDGTIEFTGTFSTLSFTTANGEYWNGFDIGLLTPASAATPEPGTLALAGTGLIGLFGAVKRRFQA
jgi:hypothetical protein